MFKDALFKKIESKTNVNKETILSLASKIQGSNMKDKNILKDVIKEIGTLTGKEVSEEMILLLMTMYQKILIKCFKSNIY